MTDLAVRLTAERETARRKAWDALARYKFWMFGYHAARWVFLTQLLGHEGRPIGGNPFREIVLIARKKVEEGRTP